LLLTLLLLTKFRGRLRGGLLAAATFTTALWATVYSWSSQGQGLSFPQVFVLEMVHDAVWIVFLSALMSGAINNSQRLWMARYGGIGLVAGLIAVGLYLELGRPAISQSPATGGVLIVGSILTSLFVLIALEQIYRNARTSQKFGLKFLSLGIGGIFFYDLVLYSNAIFAGQVSEELWVTRGIVVALCAPLVGLAVIRSPSWSSSLFVSRHVVFYTTTVFGAGIYLTAVGFLGNYLRNTGGVWSFPIQSIVVFTSLVALLVFLVSDRVRRWIRVSIAKHFFENKYDYREEWMQLIGTLTTSESSMPLRKRAIRALAQILDVNAGVIWLRQPGEHDFVCVAGWNCGSESTAINSSESLIGFLERTRWVIDLEELRIQPGRYAELSIDEAQLGIAAAGYVIPLFHDEALLGFVALERGSRTSVLNFEDHDLLKIAARQVVDYLAQENATERLSEARQFEAFNKLTAYLMHDFKNVIAQQVLLVDNAERHKNKPEFIDDAIDTIKGGVRRMRGILDHLQQRTTEHRLEKVEVGKLVMRAVSQCDRKMPVPTAKIGDRQFWVLADPEKLQMGLYHAIRNAQDATPSDGRVDVTVVPSGTSCQVEVSDDGSGMEQKFVQERLFKPFDSTKGTEGMGIGAYQLRATVLDLGGDVRVESSVGHGTTVRITIPLAR